VCTVQQCPAMIALRRIVERTLRMGLFDKSAHRIFAVLVKAFSFWDLGSLRLDRNGHMQLQVYCKGI